MSHSGRFRFWAAPWQRLALLLLVLVGLGLPLSGGTPQARAAVGDRATHAQPALLQLAATHPATRVQVIVQAVGSGAAINRLVTRLGGRVTRNLSIINAVAATVPASAVYALATAPGVRWVSLDAPVVHASSCAQCISTAAC